MVFVIGGEGSGQDTYVKKHYPDSPVCGAYHLTVKAQLAADEDPLFLAENLSEKMRNGVIWSCEIGCGIVPVDPADRRWREVTGRVHCLLAEKADVVIRMICGVPQLIRRREEPGRDGESAVPDASRRAYHCQTGSDIPRRARAVMVAGTMSNAGKSFIAAGLCRIFTQDGYRVAPFKAQNMALNSFITAGGEEMGRSQVVQAEACRRAPDVRMNPILLKPTTDKGSQVIVLGHPVGDMDAREYYRRKQDFLPYVEEAYESLAAENDILVLEGAGSPAEINLKDNDIVNMPMAEMADAAVILVGNIDPGGVFAQLYGTLQLLEPEERDRIGGMIINKFRGDRSILEPGIAMLEEKAGRPVLGVLPYCDVILEPEDSLALEEQERWREAQRALQSARTGSKPLDIVVIRLPKISNATDFDALDMEADVRLRYVTDPRKLGTPDAVILPGSKSTIRDLLWLRESGMEIMIRRAREKGTFLMGICGGYQMLGKLIRDPEGAEMADMTAGTWRATGTEVSGLGFLDMVTVFARDKIMRQTETLSAFGIPELDAKKITGYEIHMGREEGGTESGQTGDPEAGVIGTYIHGIFDEEDFRKAFLEYLYARRGEERQEAADEASLTYRDYKEKQLEDLAAVMRTHLDLPAIYRMMGL